MNSSMTPREIQARIRAGETLEAVAAAAGVGEEKVEPFAAPVLAERAHVAGTALMSPVRRAGESTGHRSLQTVAQERFVDAGLDPDEVEWDAWQEPDRKWVVVASWTQEGIDHQARFRYDKMARFSVATNDDAAVLTGEKRPKAPTRRLGDPDHEPTIDFTDEFAIVRAVGAEAPNPLSPLPPAPEEVAAAVAAEDAPRATSDEHPVGDLDDTEDEWEDTLTEIDGVYDIVPGRGELDNLYDMFSSYAQEPASPTEPTPVVDPAPAAQPAARTEQAVPVAQDFTPHADQPETSTAPRSEEPTELEDDAAAEDPHPIAEEPAPAPLADGATGLAEQPTGLAERAERVEVTSEDEEQSGDPLSQDATPVEDEQTTEEQSAEDHAGDADEAPAPSALQAGAAHTTPDVAEDEAHATADDQPAEDADAEQAHDPQLQKLSRRQRQKLLAEQRRQAAEQPATDAAAPERAQPEVPAADADEHVATVTTLHEAPVAGEHPDVEPGSLPVDEPTGTEEPEKLLADATPAPAVDVVPAHVEETEVPAPTAAPESAKAVEEPEAAVVAEAEDAPVEVDPPVAARRDPYADQPLTHPVQDTLTEETQILPTSPRVPKRKKRATVPSWDEIMFGGPRQV